MDEEIFESGKRVLKEMEDNASNYIKKKKSDRIKRSYKIGLKDKINNMYEDIQHNISIGISIKKIWDKLMKEGVITNKYDSFFNCFNSIRKKRKNGEE